MAIRILLADDHHTMRECLGALIRNHTDFDLVAEAEDGEDAVRLAGELSPDVVVMDASMPALSGIDATRQIRENGGTVRVCMLSARSDEVLVRAAMAAGAAGCVPKEHAFEELALAILAVAAGHVYLSPKLGRHAAASPSASYAR